MTLTEADTLIKGSLAGMSSREPPERWHYTPWGRGPNAWRSSDPACDPPCGVVTLIEPKSQCGHTGNMVIILDDKSLNRVAIASQLDFSVNLIRNRVIAGCECQQKVEGKRERA